MKPAGLIFAGLLIARAAFGSAVSDGFRLPNHRDAFFIENDLVYSRFIQLMHDGAYRQINQDRTACAEVDQGTWEQAADGAVRLHAARHALRFRALLAGPLSIVLDAREKIDALPPFAASVRRFLASTEDRVFEASTAAEFDAPPASANVRPGVETFSRADVQSLLRQAEDTVVSERTGNYTFTPVKVAGTPVLLILQDAVFQATDLARVRRDYHVQPGARPPFYFVQVDERTFAREVGSWQTFHFLGEPE